MKKCFNNVQIFKSSEDCKKFSKSVSYETLVGGTSAIGRDFSEALEIEGVITRRTSVRRGYLPEKCTHANKESLFASVTCFMRLPRRIQRMLLVMTIPALALIFTLITTAESQAIEIPTGGVSGTCNSAGTCLWTLDENGKMTISAKNGAKDVKMDNYTCDDSRQIGNRPWEAHITKIKDVVVGDNIINISNNAFQNAIQLETVTGMKDVKVLGVDSFAYDKKLNLVEMPSVEEVLDFALSFSSITSVDLPNIKKIIHGFGAKIEYIGLPDWDVEMINLELSNTKIPNCSNENRSACGSCGNDYVKRGVGCVKDCGAGYLGKEGRCIDASLGCGAGYRQFENFCNRIRYTPAEAAPLLHNDNTNEVTITFRK